MTKQTIDGVRRELLSGILKFADEHWHGFPGEDELRALLDAPAKPVIEISLELLNTACNGFVQEQGHALNELREILSAHKVDKNVKSTSVILDSTHSGNSSNGDSNLSIKTVAAQPQGVPVAYRIGVNGEWFYGDKLSCIRERVEYESTFTKEDFEEAGVVTPEPLYAEQPAPVAQTPINYGALDPLAVCRGHMCDCNQGRLPCRCKP